MARNPSLDLDTLQAALERADATWQMAYTTMTGLFEDQRQLRLGVPPPDQPVESLERAVPAAAAAAASPVPGAPARFDVRDVDGVDYDSPVKDQGNCGSCVAFGTAAAMEVTYRRSVGRAEPIDLSEAHLFYCHGRRQGRHCGNGWFPHQALQAAQDGGVTREDCYPYTAGDQDCSGLLPGWDTSLARPEGFRMLTGDPAAMKREIVQRGAVIACLDVYQDFFSYGAGTYSHLSGAYAGGHCVLLIGYDDGERYWLGRNSWGTGWGDGGYFRIAYGQCRIESYESAAITGVTLRGAPVPPYPGRLLRYPPLTVGQDVRQWQRRMTELGYTLVVDGKYGPAAKKACEDLQRKRGLKPDGIVGPATWTATFG